MNRSLRSKNHSAKSDKEPVSSKAASLPQPMGLPKKIGRPLGSKNKKTLAQQEKPTSVAVPTEFAEVQTIQKVKKTFDKAMADAALAQFDVSAPDFDGGGTKETSQIVSKESLERRVARRLNVLDRYLTDERLLSLLALSGLKEVGIYEGIMMDKALVLKGQPTVIIGNEDRSQIDAVLPRLLAELKRRKMITSVSERKIEFTSPGGERESL